jgi:hypothetical protein
MARRTVFARLRMQGRLRCTVAGCAVSANFGPQQDMCEALLRRFHQFWAAMVGVAGQAIGLAQRLMKGDSVATFLYRRACRGPDADIGELVACSAAIG